MSEVSRHRALASALGVERVVGVLLGVREAHRSAPYGQRRFLGAKFRSGVTTPPVHMARAQFTSGRLMRELHVSIPSAVGRTTLHSLGGVQLSKTGGCLLVLCLAVVLSGCGKKDQLSSSPAALPRTQIVSVAATEKVTPVVAPAPIYATALEYLAVADRSGAISTPGKGTPLRRALMEAARAYFHTSSQFVVHGLKVRGEVAVGVIETAPAGSGKMESVTWVLWNKAWTVASSIADGKPDARMNTTSASASTRAPVQNAGTPAVVVGKSTTPAVGKSRPPRANERPYAQATGRSTVPMAGEEGTTWLSLDGTDSHDDGGIVEYSWLVEDYSHNYAAEFHGATVNCSLSRGIMPSRITLRVDDAQGLYAVQHYEMNWTHPDGVNRWDGVLSPIQ